MHVSAYVYDQRNTSIQSNRQFAKVGQELIYMYDVYFAFYTQYELPELTIMSNAEAYDESVKDNFAKPWLSTFNV